MINLKYIQELYIKYYKKYIKLHNSMKLSQNIVKLWTNRPLGLNTNF